MPAGSEYVRTDDGSERRAKAVRLIVVACALLSAGCASIDQQGTLQAMHDDLEAMRGSLASSQEELDALRVEQAASRELNTQQLELLAGSLGNLATQIDATCEQAPIPRASSLSDCPEPDRQVIVNNGGKLILGEVESVWLDPPGMGILARTDTGASSSSLHAANITEFERDGEDWVRFEVRSEEASVEIERPVQKFVRVYQQADKSGSRRPVVEMRIHIGDVHGTYEFTLADRSHLEHDMILGRSFLTDMALVDVSRQFVQPAHSPSNGSSAALAE